MCPLFLLPSVSLVWVTALDGSLCVCILTSASLPLIWFRLCVWFFSYSFCLLCLPGFSLPHLATRLAARGITSAPAWPECFAWVHCPSFLFHCVICASPKPHGLCSYPCFPCLLPSAPSLPALFVLSETDIKSPITSLSAGKITLKTLPFRKALLLSRSDSEPIK